MSGKMYKVEIVRAIENPYHQFSEKYANITYYDGSLKCWRVVKNWDKRYSLLVDYLEKQNEGYTEVFLRDN